MKRFIIWTISAITLSGSAYAQKGQSAVGVNFGAAPSLQSGASVTHMEIGAKYQYGLSDHLRFEAALNYGLKSKGMSILEIGANFDYLFHISNKINIYPLVGVGYARLSGGDGGDEESSYASSSYTSNGNEESSTSIGKLYVNVGLGAEYNISSKLSAGIEIKYQYIKDFNRLPISLNLTYKF